MRLSAGSTRQVFNCWQPAVLSLCWSQGLERAARGDMFSTVTDNFLSTSKNLASYTLTSSELLSL